MLPTTPLLRLAPIIVSNQRDEEDNISSSKTPDGCFSVQSTYSMEVNTDLRATSDGGVGIWKLHVQQRVCVFMWLLTQDRILTNHARWHRNLEDTP